MPGFFSSQPRARVTKSVQYGSIVLTNTSANTATITAVDTSKAVLHFLGFQSDTNDVQTAARVTLTNATTVTAVRNTTSASTTTVAFDVVEYY